LGGDIGLGDVRVIHAHAGGIVWTAIRVDAADARRRRGGIIIAGGRVG